MRLKRILIHPFVLSLAVLGAGAETCRAEEASAIDDLLVRYEAIRLELVADRTTGVGENATALAEGARRLAKAQEPESTADAGSVGETPQELLTLIAGAAAKVAEVDALEATREAFFELSKPMGRYRKLTGDTSTIVVYCPMAKKAWLQPDGEIGNPYYGSAMLTCGNRVPD